MYLPKSFNELIGQESYINIVRTLLRSNELPRCVMFHGAAGSGKTSMSRITAAALNCEKFVDNSCNSCKSCQRVWTSKHPDVVEIDAAMYTGIDSIREMIETSYYRPISGKKRVFIIDEFHKLSSSGKSSLLKTLEESASFNYFFLVTTDPGTLPNSIHDRSFKVPLRLSSKEELLKLGTLLKGNLSEDQLNQVVFFSKGVPRILTKTLNLLQKSPKDELHNWVHSLTNQTLMVKVTEWIDMVKSKDPVNLERLNKLNQEISDYCLSVKEFLELIHLELRTEVTLLYKILRNSVGLVKTGVSLRTYLGLISAIIVPCKESLS